MKTLALLRAFLTLGVIVGPIPNVLANGVSTIDAIPLMANFNWLLSEVNSKAAPLASPTFTGTVTTAAITASGLITANGGVTGDVSGSSGSLATTNFTISEIGGILKIKYGATVIAQIDSSGNFSALANVAAYASI